MRFTHAFPFDPTYGYDLPTLLAVGAPPEPPDFAAFWQGRYDESLAVPPDAVLRPARGNRKTDVFDVEFTSWNGVRIGGWLTKPRDGKIERGVIVGHGYGGRDAPDLNLPIANAAALFPCLRGQSRSRLPGVPENGMEHVLYGIESRETYIHGGCAADIWCAASALLALIPEAGERLDYLGGSFGGGIGALALPWDKRFAAAHLSVPSFGNHPLRLTLLCVGSGESVRVYHQTHEEVTHVLRYFDAATAARRMTIPVWSPPRSSIPPFRPPVSSRCITPSPIPKSFLF